MKHRIRAVSVLLMAALLTVLPPRARAVEANPGIRIGLFYGTKALSGANLENRVGSGYRFGYMDGGTFIEVGRTEKTKISMVKNRDVWYGRSVTDPNSYGYFDSIQTDILVGSFHDEDGLKASREEAEARAAELREAGQKAFVYYEKGVWGVRADHYIANAQNIASKKTGSRYCISIVATGTGDILFQYDSGSLEQSLVVAPDIMETEQPQTWFKGYSYVGLFEYSRRDQNDLTVINLLDMQAYIKGLVPYEMSASWHIEALKAQAVTARTYAMRNINKHTGAGFNICNETHCQVYYGTNRATANSDRAVDETLGEYVTYNGILCDTVYSASSGGATEDSENVWGTKIDYLRGVPDIYEDISRIPNGKWTYTVDNATLTKRLTENGRPNAGVVDFYVSQFTRLGNVLEVTMVDAAGQKFPITRGSARTFFGYPSQRYRVNDAGSGLMAIGAAGEIHSVGEDMVWVVGQDGQMVQASLSGGAYIVSASGVQEVPRKESENDASKGVYLVNGQGNGHNVGMSQWGARCMAELGFTYEEIIKFYYTDVSLTKGDA